MCMLQWILERVTSTIQKRDNVQWNYFICLASTPQFDFDPEPDVISFDFIKLKIRGSP